MKKFLLGMAAILLLASGSIFTSCSHDDDDDEQTISGTGSGSKAETLTEKIKNSSGDVDLGGKTYNEDVAIGRACTVNNATFTENTITVNVAGVTLKNLKNISVVAASGIGSGDLYLEDCTITDLKVLGGGLNSIHIKGSTTIKSLEAKKEKVRIALENAVKIATLKVLKSSVKIEGSTGTNSSTIENLVVESTAQTVTINASTVKNLTVESGVENVVVGGGTIETLTLKENASGEAATVTVTKAITITTVEQKTSTGTDSTAKTTIQVVETLAESGEVELPESVETTSVSEDEIEDITSDKTETTVSELASYLAEAKAAGKTEVKAIITDATVENFDKISDALAVYGTLRGGKKENEEPDLYVDLDLTKSTGLTELPYRAFCTSKDENDSEAWKTATLALKSLELPSSVKTIKSLALWCCYYLESVTLNEGLETIIPYAFCGAARLASINIPSSVKNIDGAAFTFGSNSPEVKFETTSYEFQNKLILNKAKTEVIASLANGDITIPDTVTKINGEVFKGWSTITSIKLPTPKSGKWIIAADSKVDVSKLSAEEVAKYLTSDSEFSKYADSVWAISEEGFFVSLGGENSFTIKSVTIDGNEQTVVHKTLEPSGWAAIDDFETVKLEDGSTVIYTFTQNKAGVEIWNTWSLAFYDNSEPNLARGNFLRGDNWLNKSEYAGFASGLWNDGDMLAGGTYANEYTFETAGKLLDAKSEVKISVTYKDGGVIVTESVGGTEAYSVKFGIKEGEQKPTEEIKNTVSGEGTVASPYVLATSVAETLAKKENAIDCNKYMAQKDTANIAGAIDWENPLKGKTLTGFTLSAEVYMTEGAQYDGLLSFFKNGRTEDGGFLTIFENGNIRYNESGFFESIGNTDNTASGALTVTEKTWTKVAVTIGTDGTVTYYKDGVAVDTTKIDGYTGDKNVTWDAINTFLTSTCTDVGISVGTNWWKAGYVDPGDYIANIKIYSTALTAEQIAAIK